MYLNESGCSLSFKKCNKLNEKLLVNGKWNPIENLLLEEAHLRDLSLFFGQSWMKQHGLQHQNAINQKEKPHRKTASHERKLHNLEMNSPESSR